jgi:hypothetical protein
VRIASKDPSKRRGAGIVADGMTPARGPTHSWDKIDSPNPAPPRRNVRTDLR